MNHHGALIQAGATPVYLEASLTRLVSLAVLMRTVLMKSICPANSRRCARKSRPAAPVSPGIIQLGTYDGTVYNARQVIDTLGICVITFCLIPRGSVMNNYPDDGG